MQHLHFDEIKPAGKSPTIGLRIGTYLFTRTTTVTCCFPDEMSATSDTTKVRKDMDTTYPEHMSLLRKFGIGPEYPQPFKRQQKKNMRNRRGNRYRTQPVTFDEIKEVDEESVDDVEQTAPELASSKSHGDIRDFLKIPTGFDQTRAERVDALGQAPPSQASCAEGPSQDFFTWFGKPRQGSI